MQIIGIVYLVFFAALLVTLSGVIFQIKSKIGPLWLYGLVGMFMAGSVIVLFDHNLF
jgi:hypothetical protein